MHENLYLTVFFYVCTSFLVKAENNKCMYWYFQLIQTLLQEWESSLCGVLPCGLITILPARRMDCGWWHYLEESLLLKTVLLLLPVGGWARTPLAARHTPCPGGSGTWGGWLLGWQWRLEKGDWRIGACLYHDILHITYITLYITVSHVTKCYKRCSSKIPSIIVYTRSILNKWMNGVLSYDSALSSYTGPGTTWDNDEFCYETCPWCRIDHST